MKTIRFLSTILAMAAISLSMASCEDLFGDDDDDDDTSQDGGGGGVVKYENYTFSCPVSGSQTIKVPYISPSCLVTKKRFTKIMVCNEVNSFQKAWDDCTRDCGRRDCAEPGLGM